MTNSDTPDTSVPVGISHAITQRVSEDLSETCAKSSRYLGGFPPSASLSPKLPNEQGDPCMNRLGEQSDW